MCQPENENKVLYMLLLRSLITTINCVFQCSGQSFTLSESELNTSWMDFETIQALKPAASAPTELLIHLTDGKGKYSLNITI